MITTRFLAPGEYYQYEAWVKKLDDQTRTTYFGVPQGDYQIEQLVKGIVDKPLEHNFLVAAVSYTHLTLPTICSV